MVSTADIPQGARHDSPLAIPPWSHGDGHSLTPGMWPLWRKPPRLERAGDF